MKKILIFSLLILFPILLYADSVKVPNILIPKSGRFNPTIENVTKFPQHMILRSSNFSINVYNIGYFTALDSVSYSLDYLNNINISSETVYLFTIDSIGFDDPDSIAYVTGRKINHLLDSTFTTTTLLNEFDYNVVDSIGFKLNRPFQNGSEFEIDLVFDKIASSDNNGNLNVSLGIPRADSITIILNDTLQSVADTIYSIVFNGAFPYKTAIFNVTAADEDSCQFRVAYQNREFNGQWSGDFITQGKVISLVDSSAYVPGNITSLKLSMMMSQEARLAICGISTTGNVIFNSVKLIFFR
ncbi:MAG: hypothetical protein WC934_08405 [Acidithiobacillus sp.]|jgi:hypothetical protein|uniref:hypothetical protein n=1 Tax=Acidithiobacillus sp. TaxID=1872118 RepID=UPI00355F7C39